MGPPKAALQKGARGHPSPESFKFQVLGNATSATLRQSQLVLICHFLK